MPKIHPSSSLPLNNGVRLPLFGFGAYKVSDPVQGEEAIRCALEAGYRHIDTASIYGNEELVGRAIQNSGLQREDLFVTTKLWLDEQGEKETPAALERSLAKLQTDYVDLYLMHWPHPEAQRMQPCWEAMQALLAAGKCRAIGVSNFSERRLQELFARSDFRPAVNQVEFNLFCYRRELAAFCRDRGIVLQSYSPLARGHKLDHQTLVRLSQTHRKSPAQTMLRWCLQHGVPIIPKSSTPERIVANAQIFDFELSSPEMEQLDQLNENFEVSDWRPDPQNWY
ncbi:aldo/keto reductase [Pelagicoccus sp. SDUM812005]|uniref:aldo/keto reductase n=1 Tax=Pelagicoccus sp. SDUM812005 TaxID=3041257 RepID=UPI00280F9E1D|nr:aldo/keto reductase [Pelagicoccus sp. SDUM812005]MDQ8182042.1 aldo/keto reductase [Pelagicoccus sp. SDUM812005]